MTSTTRHLVTDRLRWRIAELLNRLPGQCWTNLVMWANRSTDQRIPWQPIDWACRADAARNGACWCGKFSGGSGADGVDGVRS
jgi:hypothetical protein